MEQIIDSYFNSKEFEFIKSATGIILVNLFSVFPVYLGEFNGFNHFESIECEKMISI